MKPSACTTKDPLRKRRLLERPKCAAVRVTTAPVARQTSNEPESVMPYCTDIELKPLTAAERRAMRKIIAEIMEMFARAESRT
jgi:hypothetical protein